MSNPLPADRGVTIDFNPQEKAELRRWVDRWKVVGPLLEADRWARLQAGSEEDLRVQSLDLLRLWQPGVPGDDGEALLNQQRLFARLRTGAGS